MDHTGGGYIHFWVKGSGSWTKFIGESYFPLSAIQVTNGSVSIDSLAQFKLPIIHPASKTSEIIKVLEIRKSVDKDTAEFFRAQRIKLN